MRLGAVLVGGLLLGLGSPARALVVDSFSTGAFNLTDTGPAGTTSTQPCGSFCLGGTREVFLLGTGLASPATAQLGVGEVVSVLPAGGQLGFTYTLASPVDLTTATDIEVWFTAFAPDADVSLTLEDDTGASQTVTLSPSFPTPPTPAAPGIVVFPLSGFASIDLKQPPGYGLRIDNISTFLSGDYNITLIEVVPDPGPSTATPLIFPGITTISGPPFPSPVLPIRAFHPPVPITPVLDIEFSIMDATNAAGPISANEVGVVAPDDNRVVFLTTTLPGGPTSPTIQYRLDYLPPSVGGIQPDDQVPVLDWTPGNDWYEVIVVVESVPMGHVFMTSFAHVNNAQTFNINNVTAVKGASTLITVELTGLVDGTIPALNMALAGEFTLTTLVPVFAPRALAPALLLAGLVVGGALVLVTRVRRRGAARL